MISIKKCFQKSARLWQKKIDKRDFFIIPIYTGTFAIDLQFLHSDYHKTVITLQPLNFESAIQIFEDKYKNANDDPKLIKIVQEQQHFQIALNDTDFIPRFIDFLLEPDKLSPNYDDDWGNFLYTNIVQRYGEIILTMFLDNDRQIIISLGLLCIPVLRTFVLPSGKSIGEAERDRGVYLKLVNGDEGETDSGKRYTVMLPFALLKIINSYLDRPIIQNSLLLNPTVVSSWRWADFEKLIPHFQSALITALINTFKPDDALKKRIKLLRIRRMRQ